jgi:cyanophycinase-like exopeptidase
MTGPVALHGGGEFLPGDEPFLRAILELAPADGGVVRIAVVPSAAARGRPELAAANGVAAFRRIAADLGVEVQVESVPIVDAASAADPDCATRLARAALIHLPGGDPDLIPALYPDSAAWAAMQTAHSGGAVLAGASAGAMALAAWTWTGRDVVPGLGVVPGLIVVPHADAASWPRVLTRFRTHRPADTGVLGVGERTGVIVPAGADGAAGANGPWRIVGPGEVRWLPVGEHDSAGTVIAHDGEAFVPTLAT